MVLLPKGGRDPSDPSAYRPLCLLDEVGKLMERVLVERLTEHLRQGAAGLSESQYGFRAGRSTIDAIDDLRARTEQIVQGEGIGCVLIHSQCIQHPPVGQDRAGAVVAWIT